MSNSLQCQIRKLLELWHPHGWEARQKVIQLSYGFYEPQRTSWLHMGKPHSANQAWTCAVPHVFTEEVFTSWSLHSSAEATLYVLVLFKYIWIMVQTRKRVHCRKISYLQSTDLQSKQPHSLETLPRQTCTEGKSLFYLTHTWGS